LIKLLILSNFADFVKLTGKTTSKLQFSDKKCENLKNLNCGVPDLDSKKRLKNFLPALCIQAHLFIDLGH